jgi:hypothetical protein
MRIALKKLFTVAQDLDVADHTHVVDHVAAVQDLDQDQDPGQLLTADVIQNHAPTHLNVANAVLQNQN